MHINVSFACNEAYMEQTTVAMTSLFENCSTPVQIHVYFVDMGVSENSIQEMSVLVEKYGASITFIKFDDIAYDLKISEKTGRHIRSVYAKLFYGRIEGIDRIIYLDSDIVVAGDISELWNVEMGRSVIAGVETIHTIEDNSKIGYSAAERAINDGVVLMNLQSWRDEKFLEKCLDYIEFYNGNPPVLSEGTINAVCKNKIAIIHPRYNLMSGIVAESARKIEVLTGRKYYSQEELDEATNDPCIIHYLSGFYNRPWCRRCTHPLKNEYLKYRDMTKWKGTPLLENDLSRRLKVIGLAYRKLPISVFNALRQLFS